MKTKNIYNKIYLFFFTLISIAIVLNSLIFFVGNKIPDQIIWAITSSIIFASSLWIAAYAIKQIRVAEQEGVSAIEAGSIPSLLPSLSSALGEYFQQISTAYADAQEKNKELEERISKDSLTHLKNRSAFNNALINLSKSDKPKKICLAMIRATELSSINQRRGRAAGDQYLYSIGEMIQYIGKHFSTDFIYRLSSSDFAILIDAPTDQIPARLGSDLKQLFDNYAIQLGTDCIAYTGITLFTNNEQPEKYLARADLALAKAQTKEANGWNLQQTNSDDAFEGESRWKSIITEVLEYQTISFQHHIIHPFNMAIQNYQEIEPKFVTKDEQKLPSDTVYAMAMRHNLMEQLEQKIVLNLLHEFKNNAKTESRLGLNLSAGSLFYSGFSVWLEALLFREQEFAHMLVFEFDEDLLDCNLSSGMKIFDMIRRVGARSCISKFGQGLGSFRNYRELRPDYVKLAPSLIDTVDRDPTSQQFVRMIVELAHRMSAVVIAEGVETMTQRETLERLYVDGIQGDIISKPQLLK